MQNTQKRVFRTNGKLKVKQKCRLGLLCFSIVKVILMCDYMNEI